MKLQDLAGQWALVTGASEGIGREFCVQLGAARVNLVMVARRQQPLNELAALLSARYAIRTLVLSADLSRSDAATEIKAAVERSGARIRLLVNNAAFGRWGHFEAANPDECEEIIKLNTMSLVSLCHRFLPHLTQFRTSAIINVSSPAGWHPMPYFALYAASKAFVNSFSVALYGEWKDRGVLVQTLVPGPTRTALHAKGGAYDTALRGFESPDVAVKAALKGLATESPMVISAPHAWSQRLFASLLPHRVSIKVLKHMFRPPANNPSLGPRIGEER